MFRKIEKHMPPQKENPAEHMRPSQEDKFPQLTAEYWANPNSQKGTVETYSCYGPVEVHHRRHEGN